MNDTPHPQHEYRPVLGERVAAMEIELRGLREDVEGLKNDVQKLTGKIDLILFAQKEREVYTAWVRWFIEFGRLLLVGGMGAMFTAWWSRH